MEYLIGALIGWLIGGSSGVILMSVLVVASKSDDQLLGGKQYE